MLPSRAVGVLLFLCCTSTGALTAAADAAQAARSASQKAAEWALDMRVLVGVGGMAPCIWGLRGFKGFPTLNADALRGGGGSAQAARSASQKAAEWTLDTRVLVGVGAVAATCSGMLSALSGVGGPPLILMYELLAVPKARAPAGRQPATFLFPLLGH